MIPGLVTLEFSQLTDTVGTNDYFVLIYEERKIDWLNLDQMLAPGQIGSCDQR